MSAGARATVEVEIDAGSRGGGGGGGEIGSTLMVAGVPLVVRLLRQLARAGWSSARVVASDDLEAVRLLTALERYPVPARLAVEVVARESLIHVAKRSSVPLRGPERPGAGEPGAAASPLLHLDGRALYARDALVLAREGGSTPSPAPLMRLRDRSDVAAAERLLDAQIRKTVASDGFIAHYFIRPLTRPITRWLLPTRVSPDQVTIVALVCGLAAAAFAAAGGGRAATAVAGLLYWIGNALDCVDGDLARLRVESSKRGEWLDSLTDEISTFSLLAGLGVGLWRDGAGAAWLAIGLGGSAIGALTVALLYADLHRLGLPIDSAQFPWFFRPGAGAQAPAATTSTAALARAGGALTYLVRRDVNVTIVALLCLLDARQVASTLFALGALFGAGLTLTHYVVMARRRSRR